MKKCPFCSAEMNDSDEICPVCKKNINAEDDTSAIKISGRDSDTADLGTPKKKNKGLKIALIVLAIVLILILLVIFVFKPHKKPKPSDYEDQTVATLAPNEYVTDDYGNQIPIASNNTSGGQSGGSSEDKPSSDEKNPSQTPANPDKETPKNSEQSQNDLTNSGGNPKPTKQEQQGNQNSANPNQPQQNEATPQKPNENNAPVQNQGNSQGGDQGAVQGVNALTYFVDSLNNKTYYMHGVMTTGGESIPIGMMFCGNNTRMSAEIEGMLMDMAVVDGVVYVINTEKKTYVTVGQSTMEGMGIDLKEFQTEEINWNLGSPDKATKETANVDGNVWDCYTLSGDAGVTKVYFDGNTVKRFDRLNEDGTIDSSMAIDTFRGNITNKDLVPGSDFEQQDLLTFFKDILPDMD